MRINYIKILIFACLMQIIVFAQSSVAQIIPEAGTINTHDLETLRKFEEEKQIEADFQKFQKEEIKQDINKPKKKDKKKL